MEFCYFVVLICVSICIDLEVYTTFSYILREKRGRISKYTNWSTCNTLLYDFNFQLICPISIPTQFTKESVCFILQEHCYFSQSVFKSNSRNLILYIINLEFIHITNRCYMLIVIFCFSLDNLTVLFTFSCDNT